MKLKLFLTILCLLLQNSNFARDYIHGNGFRAIADYFVENGGIPFNPETVGPRSIIYIETDFLDHFFLSIFPRLSNPVILITHNGDWPSPGRFVQYLDDPKIIMWFGQNCDIQPHPKFYPIPIGIANPKWGHGNPKIFDAVLNRLEKKGERKRLSQLYINFSPGTNPVRSQLIHMFKSKPLAVLVSMKPVQKYLMEMSHYKFVLSPWGNGLDCHRTWEALLVGCIPVVKTSTLDPLYEDLPVIIVQDWHEITEDFLQNRYQEMKDKKYNQEKLFMNYWIDFIKSYKNN